MRDDQLGLEPAERGSRPASFRALAELRKILPGGKSGCDDSERDQSVSLGEAPQPVLINKVCFSYPGSERQVLRDLSLEIRPGELLAIVGLNGAGKSMLIKLLAGLYRPSSGTITVGGTDILAAGGLYAELYGIAATGYKTVR